MITLGFIAGYLLIGTIFSIPFLTKWVHLIDEGATGSSVFFKMTIFPGVVVLWPFLLKKVLYIKKDDK